MESTARDDEVRAAGVVPIQPRSGARRPADVRSAFGKLEDDVRWLASRVNDLLNGGSCERAFVQAGLDGVGIGVFVIAEDGGLVYRNTALAALVPVLEPALDGLASPVDAIAKAARLGAVDEAQALADPDAWAAAAWRRLASEGRLAFVSPARGDARHGNEVRLERVGNMLVGLALPADPADQVARAALAGLEHAETAFIVVHAGEVAYANAATGRLFPELAEARAASSVLPARLVATIGQLESANGGGERLLEIGLAHERQVRVRARAIPWGRQVGVLVECVDVTADSAARASAVDNERRFRALVEGSIQGIIVSDIDGRPVFANDAAARMFGYGNAQELMHLASTTELAREEDRPALGAERGRLARSGQGQPMRWHGVRKDGRETVVLSVGTVVAWRPGCPPCIQETLIDLTEEHARACEQEVVLRAAEAAAGARTVHDALTAVAMVLYRSTGLPFVGIDLYGPDKKLAARGTGGDVRTPVPRAGAVRRVALADPDDHRGKTSRRVVANENLEIDGKEIGVISFQSRDGAEITESQVRIARTVAHHVAMTIGRLQVQEQLLERRSRLDAFMCRGGRLSGADDAALLGFLVDSFEDGEPHDVEMLMSWFGGLGDLLAASPARLEEVGAAHLAPLFAAVRELCSRVVRSRLMEGDVDVIECYDDLVAHLRSVYAGAAQEWVHTLFLDQANRLLLAEDVAFGSSATVDLEARPIAQRAMEVRASRLVLAHNHPSGSSRPSAEDLHHTRRLCAVLSELKIEVVDHVIVSPEGTYSMARQGVLYGMSATSPQAAE